VSGELDIDWAAEKCQCEPFDVPDRVSLSAWPSILGSGMEEAHQHNSRFIQQEMVRPTFAPILQAAFSSSGEEKKCCD
jgi:hypothetical protein